MCSNIISMSFFSLFLSLLFFFSRLTVLPFILILSIFHLFTRLFFIFCPRTFCKLQLCLMSAVVCYGSLFSSINKDSENQISSEWMTDWMPAYPEPFRTGSWSIFSELMIFRASWMGADSLMVIGFSRRRSDTCLCHHLHHQINHITMFNNFISDLDGNSINYN